VFEAHAAAAIISDSGLSLSRSPTAERTRRQRPARPSRRAMTMLLVLMDTFLIWLTKLSPAG
jgi:hypothetical protein